MSDPITQATPPTVTDSQKLDVIGQMLGRLISATEKLGAEVAKLATAPQAAPAAPPDPFAGIFGPPAAAAPGGQLGAILGDLAAGARIWAEFHAATAKK